MKFRIYTDPKTNEVKLFQYIGDPEDAYPLLDENTGLNIFVIEGVIPHIGDLYDPKTNSLIVRPEHHPQPLLEEIIEIKIKQELRSLAIERLKAKGEIPTDYVDTTK